MESEKCKLRNFRNALVGVRGDSKVPVGPVSSNPPPFMGFCLVNFPGKHDRSFDVIGMYWDEAECFGWSFHRRNSCLSSGLRGNGRRMTDAPGIFKR